VIEFPDDDHARFLALLLRHEPMIRASIRAVVHRPEDVDDVMQAVSIVAWRKFDQLTDERGFGRWACMIARYEVLKFQRERAREQNRLVLDEALVSLILEEAADEISVRGRRLALLEHCLQRLPEARRALVMQAYTPGSTMRALAERLGQTEDGLYQLLRRIRLALKDCVEGRLAQEGGAA
jgi:RNA polymerase sigma-70 factor (ECF subfamily)